jgi:hypothetical protein
MIHKHLLVAPRLRRPPDSGWSWVDRRFLHEHGEYLSSEALLLYFFLVAVADREGLSYYSDRTLSSRLRLPREAVERARQELLQRDLIAHQLPLVQVLSLPTPTVQRRPHPGQGLIVLGELLRRADDPITRAVTAADILPSPPAPLPEDAGRPETPKSQGDRRDRP